MWALALRDRRLRGPALLQEPAGLDGPRGRGQPASGAARDCRERAGGTLLVGGLVKEVLAANSTGVARRFDLVVDAVPAQDFAVVVKGQGGVTSVRAVQSDRFGRPASRLIDPPCAPRPLTVPGQELGTPIQLPPPTHP